MNEDTRSLSAVALFLYGRASMARRIAKWNKIELPYHIRLGQKLVLRQAPTLSPEQGARRVLAFWRKKFHLNDSDLENRENRKIASVRPKVEPLPKDAITPTAETAYEEGVRWFQRGEHTHAVEAFRRASGERSNYFAAWFYELRALDKLGRVGELHERSRQFISLYPQMKTITVMSHYLGEPPSQDPSPPAEEPDPGLTEVPAAGLSDWSLGF